jgi:hypothetical protein
MQNGIETSADMVFEAITSYVSKAINHSERKMRDELQEAHRPVRELERRNSLLEAEIDERIGQKVALRVVRP